MFFGLLFWVGCGLLLGWCASLAPGHQAQRVVQADALAGGAAAVGGYLRKLGLDKELMDVEAMAAALVGALLLLAAYHLTQRAFSR